MTDSAELAHEVLIRVAEFVRKLPADQLAELARGEVKLAIEGARRAPRRTSGANLPRPADEIEATLRGIGDRRSARRYLETDLKLTAAQLQAFGAAKGITVRTRKPQALDDVVEWAVGRRLDSDAITRNL